MLANRRSRKLLGGVWFCLRDHRALPGPSDYWGYRSGLLDVDGDPKPSLDQGEPAAGTERR
jgi:hypothetical protein